MFRRILLTLPRQHSLRHLSRVGNGGTRWPELCGAKKVVSLGVVAVASVSMSSVAEPAVPMVAMLSGLVVSPTVCACGNAPHQTRQQFPTRQRRRSEAFSMDNRRYSPLKRQCSYFVLPCLPGGFGAKQNTTICRSNYRICRCNSHRKYLLLSPEI